MTRAAGGAGTNQYTRRGQTKAAGLNPTPRTAGTPGLVQQAGLPSPLPAEPPGASWQPPRISLTTMQAYRDTYQQLAQWAPTVHQLVQERIAALMEAHGPYNHPLETTRQYTERVLAHGQHPFPPGASLYDNLSCNTGFEHISVGYGLAEDGEIRITYTGRHPEWAADGESYELRTASVHCPGWLVSEPDGVERYRQQTAEMAVAVQAEQTQLTASIQASIDEVMATRGTKT